MKTDEVNPRIAHGGKAIYGARLGILMLEARFPRIPGDMGNCRHLAVSGALQGRERRLAAACGRRESPGLLPDFVAAAQELAELGARISLWMQSGTGKLPIPTPIQRTVPNGLRASTSYGDVRMWDSLGTVGSR